MRSCAGWLRVSMTSPACSALRRRRRWPVAASSHRTAPCSFRERAAFEWNDGPVDRRAARGRCRHVRRRSGAGSASSCRRTTSGTTSPSWSTCCGAPSTAWRGVIFVERAIRPAGPAAAVRAIGAADDRVRCIRRIGRRARRRLHRGHPVEPGAVRRDSRCRHAARRDAARGHARAAAPARVDVVVGSRYIPGGSADSFTSKRRFAEPAVACRGPHDHKVDLSRTPAPGFFMIRRDAVEPLAAVLAGLQAAARHRATTARHVQAHISRKHYTFRQHHLARSSTRRPYHPGFRCAPRCQAHQ